MEASSRPFQKKATPRLNCWQKPIKATRDFSTALENKNIEINGSRACDKYKAAHAADPEGPLAAEAIYRSAVVTYELFKRSFKPSDKTNSLALLRQTADAYPGSPLAHEAEKKVAAITGQPMPTDTADAIQQVITEAETSVRADDQDDTQYTGSHTLIQGLRHWSNPSYTRIVIDANRETSYQHRLLNQDPSINKPKRLYVDLDHSRLGEDFEKVVPINDNLLSNVRAGQYTSESVQGCCRHKVIQDV